MFWSTYLSPVCLITSSRSVSSYSSSPARTPVRRTSDGERARFQSSTNGQRVPRFALIRFGVFRQLGGTLHQGIVDLGEIGVFAQLVAPFRIAFKVKVPAPNDVRYYDPAW